MLNWIETLFIFTGFIFCYIGGLFNGYEKGKNENENRK